MALLKGDFDAATAFNVLTIPLCLIFVLEIIYRAAMLVVERRVRIPRALIRADLLLHVALLGAYLVYAVVFCIQTLL